MKRLLRCLLKNGVRILLVMLLGGLLGATLVRLSPGYGVEENELNSRLSRESVEALRAAHAQDASIPRFYLAYLSRLAHGDLGQSATLDEPVTQLLAERLPETLKSVAIGLGLGWALGLALALAAVASRGAANAAASAAAAALLSVPTAVMALLLVMARAPGRLAIGLIVFPKIFQYARNLLLRCAAMPHVLTARAKGLGGARILFRHILPVAGAQLLALAGVSVSMAFAAAIPVEAVCDLPGIGQLAWKAAMGRDLVLLVDLTMLVTLVTLAANMAGELVAQPGRTGEA